MTTPADNEKQEPRMSYKKGSLAVLALIAALGLGYGILAQNMRGTQQFGPSFVPTLLAIILVVACIGAGTITVLRKDHDLPVGQVGKVAATIAITAGYMLIWQYTGAFYLPTVIFLISLLCLLDQFWLRRKNIIVNLSVAVLLTVFVYFFFEVLLGVRF